MVTRPLSTEPVVPVAMLTMHPLEEPTILEVLAQMLLDRTVVRGPRQGPGLRRSTY